MENLTQLTVNSFINLLASNAPAPGGGSVAALTGAMGVGLIEMVTKLTIGRKKYAEYEELMQEISAETAQIRKNLTESIDKDTQAYNAVSAVFAMPKSNEAEKSARAAAMQDALKGAALVPFEVMGFCMEGLEMAKRAMGKSNPNAASDLGVAGLNLIATCKSAWKNVDINLSGIKDEKFVAEYRNLGLGILQNLKEYENIF
ncbi:MAG: cyclodeaminase/cyclohydrolase family protein [Defluviitaleaceae bacterium]|nr:cyclodeaminase/cyclohydrolase family protein [Defluviitaleaceae bacterium]